ncbi:iron chelate uptake ABC transporter family permease subunit [Aestuariimicrobium ganziense]|uniref:iron chelate uptake ABC transporter family permease subunit n=1 Tax=Aestuariimicrobium ganziense TaxID=2773677 RepID=UPI0019419F6A|nr:iron chelate uptake ABC transporter family permease subunit [Aestuariimicrobium ganziense]
MTALATPGTTATAPRWTSRRRLLLLAALALASIIAFLAIGSGGDLAFTAQLRGTKVATMVLVGWATGVSTVAFHTITNNRILTPSVMGLDALYAFLVTLLAFVLGVTFTGQLGPYGSFAITLVLMVVFGLGLTSVLTRKGSQVHLLVLIGIVLGTLLRSLSSLLTRMMDPTTFLVVQGNLFASFNAVQPMLLLPAGVLTVAGSWWLWHRRHELDVMRLGPDHATSLGVDWTRMVREVLLVAVVLVSVSTALVGPITFLGLLVANIAYEVTTTGRHSHTMPMAGLIAITTLVGGQAVLEQVFGLATLLSVIIEFGGGLVFIWLVLRGSRK